MIDKWEEISKESFDLTDNDDIEAFEQLPKTDPNLLKDHLVKVIDVVNRAKFDLNGWVKFKSALLKNQKKWPKKMFKCATAVDDETFEFNIGIELLDDNSYQCYVVHAAIENIWGLYSIGHDLLPSIWDVVAP